MKGAKLSDKLGAAFAGGTVALAYANFDDGRDDAHAEYLKTIQPYRRDEGYQSRRICGGADADEVAALFQGLTATDGLESPGRTFRAKYEQISTRGDFYT